MNSPVAILAFVTPASDATIVSATIGGTALTASANAGEYRFDATALSDGDHTITVVTADAAGNETTTTKTKTTWLFHSYY